MLNSIVAGNAANATADIYNAASFDRYGNSIVEGFGGTAATGIGQFINFGPGLAPLGDYGGPTLTMALVPFSKARDGSSGSNVTSDQRGFPIVGTPDIGAYEAGTLAPNYNAYLWETLPTTSSVAQHAGSFDYDGDGQSNYSEWLAQTDATDARSVLRLSNVYSSTTTPGEGYPGGRYLSFDVPTVPGRTYYFDVSGDLKNWTTEEADPGTGTTMTQFLGPIEGTSKSFVRVRVGP